MYEHFWKRAFDILLSVIGLVLLSWLFALIAIMIVIDDPGPIFFKQKRVGIHKSIFYIHKYRSMKTGSPMDVPTHLMSDPSRYTTKVGRFIRKTSLDELPQLWDILCGKMSLIGPRPALWNQDDLIAERDKNHANDVKPGLTGWAQINGRDELDIPAKAAMDGFYAKKLKAGGWAAFFFDCSCFFQTFYTVLAQDGIQKET